MKNKDHAINSQNEKPRDEKLPFLIALIDVVTTDITPEIHTPLNANERRAVADKIPFFLRLWWLREDSGNEHFITLGNQMFTTPVGTPYSDPLCDAGSADLTR